MRAIFSFQRILRHYMYVLHVKYFFQQFLWQQKLTWPQTVLLFAAVTFSEMLFSHQDALGAVLLKIRDLPSFASNFCSTRCFFQIHFPLEL